jgi:hypothetical protein
MELNLKKWEAYMQQDPALLDRLQRLNPQGYPATRKGDLLCLKAGKRSMIVNWDGKQLHVESREPKKAFLTWNIAEKKFNEVFLSGKTPPVLVAMNNDQKNIKAEANHHNGSLVISFMVMLQECNEGGARS